MELVAILQATVSSKIKLLPVPDVLQGSQCAIETYKSSCCSSFLLFLEQHLYS